MCVPWLGREKLVGLFEGLGQLPLFDEGLQILKRIGTDRAAQQTGEEQGGGESTF